MTEKLHDQSREMSGVPSQKVDRPDQEPSILVAELAEGACDCDCASCSQGRHCNNGSSCKVDFRTQR